MRILFFVDRAKVRRFDSLIRALADKGHRVVIAQRNAGIELSASREKRLQVEDERPPSIPATLARIRGVEVKAYTPFTDVDRAYALNVLRLVRNYLWFLVPPQSASGFNRRRVQKRLAGLVGTDSWRLGSLSDLGLSNLRRAAADLEALVPADPAVADFVRANDPDVVLVSPLIPFYSPQTEVVKAARELGIPSGLLVFSWDNLSNKGTLHVMPDRVFVWNEVQRREAIELHGVPAERVIATGAPRLDAFFEMKPRIDRERFYRERGLDPERPMVLYVGSSGTVCPDELPVADAWLDAVRAAPDPVLREANVVVRPYPATKVKARWEEWRPRDPRAVLERSPELDGYQGLYDHLHHAAAVVGLNTSAQIEASVLGKPVFTFGAGSLAPGQEQTLHFGYLLPDQGGFVQYAPSLEEHAVQLARGLAGDYDAEAILGFAESFLRPRGLDQPVAPILAAEIEALAGLRASRARSIPPRLRQPSLALSARRRLAKRVRAQRPNGHGRQEAAQTRAQSGVETVLVDYERHALRILAESKYERRWRANACHREPFTVAWLESEIAPGDVVYDVGANVGVFSLIGATLVGDGGVVVAFEPGYASYARLCDNIALNQLSSRIVPVPIALSSASGLQAFTYRSQEPGQSRHEFAAAVWRPDGAANGKHYTQPMVSVTLDEAVAHLRLPAPNLVKLDVDGAELHVLRGGHQMLTSDTCRSVFVEIDDELTNDVVALLESYGFSLESRHRRKESAQVWHGLFRRARA
jgi:FkbM family methyltransferase